MSSLDPATRERIETVLKSHHVVLFMKGDRQQPMCGFSAAATNILNELLPEYHTVDVLQDAEIRGGIKEYGNWPTIPQLYVDGELVGGADIVRQMYGSGELHQLFGLPAPDRTPPEITISDAAAKAIRDSMEHADGLALHLEIGRDQSAGFQLAPAGDSDIIASSNGLDIHFDPDSAKRAKGIVIDWVSTEHGEGLSLSFPGSGQIRDLAVADLKARLAKGDITLVDVRSAAAREQLPALPQARILEDEGDGVIGTLPKDTELAFICQKGISSRTVAERYIHHGFTHVYSVTGGMEAWAATLG